MPVRFWSKDWISAESNTYCHISGRYRRLSIPLFLYDRIEALSGSNILYNPPNLKKSMVTVFKKSLIGLRKLFMMTFSK